MTTKSKACVAPTEYILSNDVIKLYDSAAVQNVNEAVTVLFHAFLLESGLAPKDCSNEDKYQSMPENWNSNGIFKIKYVHYCCPSFTSYMTCVPLYNSVSVHGILSDNDCPESVNFKVNVKKFLKQKKDLSKVSEVFCNIDELSRLFKDHFCLPLLNLLHEKIGKYPLYGIHGLYEELKMHLLINLPVEGVVSMSAVNKNFHRLANSPFLWKHLYKRDFPENNIADGDGSAFNTNWKQMYKTEHFRMKRKSVHKTCRTHYHLPEFVPVRPDYYIGIGREYFEPEFNDIWPHPPYRQHPPTLRSTYPCFPFNRRFL